MGWVVIEVAESSNESGSEPNKEERPIMLTQATREVVGNIGQKLLGSKLAKGDMVNLHVISGLCIFFIILF
jgi:hypothetical protein